jgi:hypothetical protein
MSSERRESLEVMRTHRWTPSFLFAPDEPLAGAPPEEPFMPPPGAIPDPAAA